MRCCYPVTLTRRVQEGGPPTEGEVLACDYCPESMIYLDGAWRWKTAGLWRGRHD